MSKCLVADTCSPARPPHRISVAVRLEPGPDMPRQCLAAAPSMARAILKADPRVNPARIEWWVEEIP